MVDKFDKETRSRIMRSIKSKWTWPERLAHNTLKGNRIRHKMHPKMTGNPDILVKNKAVFIDGDFWHFRLGTKIPKTNRRFWLNKLIKNKIRDFKTNIKLRREGWEVIRIWETDLKRDPKKLLGLLS